VKDPVILDKLEEEYLLRVLESAMHVRKLRQFFFWTQGEVQGLLPHDILICIQFGENDAVKRIECLHSETHDPRMIKQLCNPVDGLALRLAWYCRANQLLPCVIERGTRDEQHPLGVFQAEVIRNQLHNALVHGTELLSGGATFFAFFSLPDPITARQAFFIELLLPWLHLAFLRVAALDAGESYVAAKGLEQPLTAREIGILHWVTKGKSNYEISVILELSPLTVKNHMQKIFKKLNVHNRVQAVLHCHKLQLLNAEDVKARVKK